MPGTGTRNPSTEQHVQHSAATTAPEWVIKELRQIDSTVDLVYFGQGRWLLGAVSPNPYRQNIGDRMLKASRMVSVGIDSQRKQDRVRFARLVRQGFRPIKMYRTEEGEGRMPWGRLINDFRQRDRNYRVALDDHLEEAEKRIDGTRDKEKTVATLREAAEAKASDIVSKVFRNATQFLQTTPLGGEEDDDG